MASGIKNKWLDQSSLINSIDDIDQQLMEAWASDVSLGDLLNNMPSDLKKDLFKYIVGIPIRTHNGFQINIHIPE